MKKTISFVLALIMLCTMAACGTTTGNFDTPAPAPERTRVELNGDNAIVYFMADADISDVEVTGGSALAGYKFRANLHVTVDKKQDFELENVNLTLTVYISGMERWSVSSTEKTVSVQVPYSGHAEKTISITGSSHTETGANPYVDFVSITAASGAILQ